MPLAIITLWCPQQWLQAQLRDLLWPMRCQQSKEPVTSIRVSHLIFRPKLMWTRRRSSWAYSCLPLRFCCYTASLWQVLTGTALFHSQASWWRGTCPHLLWSINTIYPSGHAHQFKDMETQSQADPMRTGSGTFVWNLGEDDLFCPWSYWRDRRLSPKFWGMSTRGEWTWEWS